MAPGSLFSGIWLSLFSERTTRLWPTMPQNSPELCIAMTLLRIVQGWSQKELSEASGVPGNLLSDYERGRKPLSRERLELLLPTMGLASDSIDQALAFIRLVRVSSPPAGIPGDAQRRRIEIVASEIGARSADFARWALTRLTTSARAEEERQDAEALWARLKTRKPPERRRLVEGSERFRSWALCELVCKESVDAARDSADRALDLADLALRIAELTPGEEAWRFKVQGYAWAHAGNARRVKGDLPGADEAFHRARKFLMDGDAGPKDLLDEVRTLDLEASLRREQGRFPEALSLLDRALSSGREEPRPRILLNRATVLEALGDFEEAVKSLRQASLYVEATGEAKLLLALQFNLAVNLCFLQRYEEADRLLPKIKKLATALGNSLDLVRLRWLEGRIAAGLGNRAEAMASFTRVQEEFTSRGIGFDAALVSLELTSLYMQEGRTAEVGSLARQMMWIFHVQGVSTEVLAALRLFCQAAERDAVTIELAGRLVRYLHRAQYDSRLRLDDVR